MAKLTFTVTHDAKKVGSYVDWLARSWTNVSTNLPIVLASVVMHAIRNGDDKYVQQTIAILDANNGKTPFRISDFKRWLVNSDMPFVVAKDDNGKITGVKLNGDKVKTLNEKPDEDLIAQLSKPFWEKKPDKSFEDFDLDIYIKRLIGKAKKAEKEKDKYTGKFNTDKLAALEKFAAEQGIALN